MRRFGRLLAILGLALGAAAGLGVILPAGVFGLSWLVGVGMVKLAIVSALALIAGGAIVERTAIKAEEREQRLPPGGSA